MKRKRLILTTVLLACVAAVVVPRAPQLWITLRYERHIAPAQDGMYAGMDYLTKRFDWLDVPPIRIPTQECGTCSIDRHSNCFATLSVRKMNRWQVRAAKLQGVALPDGPDPVSVWMGALPHRADVQVALGRRDAIDNFTCTCPDPSHEWNR